MFADDLDAFAEVQEAILRLMQEAEAGDWALPSGGCPGWTVPALDGTVRVDLHGPGARQVGLVVREGRFAVSDAPGDGVRATVRSSTADLLRWATQRRSWRDLEVTVEGDRDAVGPALDVIRVF